MIVRTEPPPGGGYDGGVQASVAGQSHSDGDGPAHHAKSVICKRLDHTQTGQLIEMNRVVHMSSTLHTMTTDHRHGVAGQYRTDVQHGVVRHVGQDVDDGDDGHRDGDRQRQVPVTGGRIRTRLIQAFAHFLQEQKPFRVLNLLGDKVQGVPAGVREEGGVER